MAIKKIKVDNKEFSISYEIFNLDKRKNIIFLHGWGANKEIMKIFKDYFDDFRLVFIDMPGFGKSSNDYVLTTYDYKEIIDEFLRVLDIKKDIIVGHSFGGKVATLLNPDTLVLLSSAGILEKKPFLVKLKIKIFKILKTFGFAKFRKIFMSDDVKGMSENMYETFKNVLNEDFSGHFRDFKGKAVVFGGERDSAVSKESVKKQAQLLNVKPIILDGGHYFFFNDKDALKNREIIKENILKEIK